MNGFSLGFFIGKLDVLGCITETICLCLHGCVGVYHTKMVFLIENHYHEMLEFPVFTRSQMLGID